MGSYFDPSPPSITPTLGAELLTNGDFETGNPPTGWTALNATLSQVLDGGSNRLSVVATAVNGRGYQSVVTVKGEFYRLSGQARSVAGAGAKRGSFVGVFDTNPITESSFSPVAATVSAPSTSLSAGAATAVIGEQGYFDDFTLKHIDLASMLGSVQDMGGESVTQEVKLTMPGVLRFDAGLVFGIDDQANPQNLIAVYHRRYASKVYISQLVAGVWTDLQVTSSIFYVAGALLKAQKLNNQITVWYNGALVGSANVPCTANPYTKHGLMATDVSVTFADFTIVAMQIVAVGQVTESDLAQPIARVKRLVIGQAAETELAQPIGPLKAWRSSDIVVVEVLAGVLQATEVTAVIVEGG